METLFQRLVVVTSDGFGRLFEGERDGRRWVIRVVPGLRLADVSAELRLRLANPRHPAFLPVEMGAADSGIYMASPAPGVPLGTLLMDSAARARIGPTECVEIGLTLVDAALASDVDVHGWRLGPLARYNVFLDRERPGKVWVMPLWPTAVRTCDWLERPVEDLTLIDRDVLRQRPSPRSDVFAIAGLLLVIDGDVEAQRNSRAGLDSASFITAAVCGEHPLQRAPVPSGPLHSLLRAALGRGPELATVGALGDALAALADGLDPQTRAWTLWRSGKAMEAQATIRQALAGADPRWTLHLLKAAIEDDQGHRGRGVKSLQGLVGAVPTCRAAWLRIGEWTGDAHERVRALENAVSLDPFTLELRIAYARALRATDQMISAHHILLHTVLLAAADPGQELIGGVAAVELAGLYLELGDPVAAEALVASYRGAGVPPFIRVEALHILGQIDYEAQRFEPASQLLRDAVQLDDATRAAGARPELVSLLAYALIGSGARVEARAVVQKSLRRNPEDRRLLQLSGVLDETPPAVSQGG